MRAIIALTLLALLSGCSAKKIEPDKEAAEMYFEAAKALRTGNFQTAITKYQELEARYPFGIYTEQAQLEIPYAYFKYEEADSAVAAAERFIRLYPRHEHVDYAYYIKGLANFNRSTSILEKWFPRNPARHDQSSLMESFRAFEQLTRRYPESIYYSDARQRMIFLRNTLAEHELEVARYYIKRKAWLAAANRGKSLLEKFEGAPATAEALDIMARCYDKLELNDLAADSRKVLALNYPDYKPKKTRD